MAFLLLGAPGSGKGTQAKNFVSELGCVHLSTGDLLRNEVAAKTPLGVQLKELMGRGEYVSDEIVFELLENFVKGLSDRDKIVFDGFPRTRAQIDLLLKLLEKFSVTLTGVFNIKVPDQMIVERMSGRLVCGKCGTVYNKIGIPPKQEGVCDSCKATLTVRADDNEEVVKNRLRIHHETVNPVLQYYSDHGVLVQIDGTLPSQQVWASILDFIQDRT